MGGAFVMRVDVGIDPYGEFGQGKTRGDCSTG